MFFLAKPGIFILRFAKKYSFCLAKASQVRGLSWQKLLSPMFKILRFAKKRTSCFSQTMSSKLLCFANLSLVEQTFDFEISCSSFLKLRKLNMNYNEMK